MGTSRPKPTPQQQARWCPTSTNPVGACRASPTLSADEGAVEGSLTTEQTRAFTPLHQEQIAMPAPHRGTPEHDPFPRLTGNGFESRRRIGEGAGEGHLKKTTSAKLTCTSAGIFACLAS